jgi:hypothetical protein
MVGDQLIPLLKCPFCSFRNIHRDTITHHIRWKDDSKHDVDVAGLDKRTYLVTKNKKEGHYVYEKKENLPLPWLKCPWCDYRDKVERDLEWHIIENKKCRIRLYKMKVAVGERLRDPGWTRDPFSWMYSDLEYRLYKAVKLAKRKSGIGG